MSSNMMFIIVSGVNVEVPLLHVVFSPKHSCGPFTNMV